jgi:hypothetical protein
MSRSGHSGTLLLRPVQRPAVHRPQGNHEMSSLEIVAVAALLLTIVSIAGSALVWAAIADGKL